MDTKPRKTARTLKLFWFLSSASILLSFVIAICAYRSKFGGALSDNSSDWSNFGSYMGGIFGPLVSFVTLLAVLKTVYLQRELIDAQREEFDRMNAVQQKTFDAQLNQNSSIATDANRSRVSNYQDTILQLLNQQIAIQQNVVNLIDANSQAVSHQAMTWDARAFAEKQISASRNKALTIIEELSKLSVQIALFEYGSVEQIRNLAVEKVDSVLPWFSELRDNAEAPSSL